ncbi:MAG: hypothetical protein IPG32_19395 [Saprospirales bacterium]|nr:hypothetical protein [Saprospirales bacterium]
MELKSIKNADGSFVRSFEANGRRYTIRTPQEGVGIYRHTKMMQMGAVLGMNATFATIYNNLKRAEECVDSLVTKSPRFRELGLVLNDMRRGVVEGSRSGTGMLFSIVPFLWYGMTKTYPSTTTNNNSRRLTTGTERAFRRMIFWPWG